jgi:hypothetical protein
MIARAPFFAIFFEKIQAKYVKLSLNEETAAKEQGRAIENLRDIVARTPVLDRISSEREAAKEMCELAHIKDRDQDFDAEVCQVKSR